MVKNALSFDFEEYFQVHGFQDSVSSRTWGAFDSRLRFSTERILERLAGAEVKATFFILGWNIDRDRELIKLIAAQGHEIASHGWSHKLIYHQTREEFFDDIHRSKTYTSHTGY